jgi:hypothetical protein
VSIDPTLKEAIETALAAKHAAESKGRITYEVSFMDDDNCVLHSVRSRNLEKAMTALSETPDGATYVSISTVYGNLCEEIERYDICDGRLFRRTEPPR